VSLLNPDPEHAGIRALRHVPNQLPNNKASHLKRPVPSISTALKPILKYISAATNTRIFSLRFGVHFISHKMFGSELSFSVPDSGGNEEEMFGRIRGRKASHCERCAVHRKRTCNSRCENTAVIIKHRLATKCLLYC
jgi:hypothetical protein